MSASELPVGGGRTMSTEQALDTEQALIAMIQNPGKKFTDGKHIVSFKDELVIVQYGLSQTGPWTINGFLRRFVRTTWTEHKEPITIECEFEVKFDEGGHACTNLSGVIRDASGGDDAVAGKTFKVKGTATEVL